MAGFDVLPTYFGVHVANCFFCMYLTVLQMRSLTISQRAVQLKLMYPVWAKRLGMPLNIMPRYQLVSLRFTFSLLTNTSIPPNNCALSPVAIMVRSQLTIFPFFNLIPFASQFSTSDNSSDTFSDFTESK